MHVEENFNFLKPQILLKYSYFKQKLLTVMILAPRHDSFAICNYFLLKKFLDFGPRCWKLRFSASIYVPKCDHRWKNKLLSCGDLQEGCKSIHIDSDNYSKDNFSLILRINIFVLYAYWIFSSIANITRIIHFTIHFTRRWNFDSTLSYFGFTLNSYARRRISPSIHWMYQFFYAIEVRYKYNIVGILFRGLDRHPYIPKHVL